MQTKYYEWMAGHRVSIKGLNFASLHFHQKCLKQRTSGVMLVRVVNLRGDGTGTVESTIEAVCRLQGGFFEDDRFEPFSKFTLFLRGVEKHGQKPVFVILELDQTREAIVRAKFSPVQFTLAGRPKLPKYLRENKYFFVVAGIVFGSGGPWTPESLAVELQKRMGCQDYEFGGDHALFHLEEMLKLGLVNQDPTDVQLYWRTMDAYKFTDLFDLNIPALPMTPDEQSEETFDRR